MDYEDYQTYQVSNQLGALFFIIIMIIAIPFVIKFMDPTFGEYQANQTVGLAVSVTYPPVAPIYTSKSASNISVIFTVSNNLDGVPATFTLCLENTGLFTLESNKSCVSETIQNGQNEYITFNLKPPSYKQYLNIPYTQTMLWVLTYSYRTSASGKVYFVSPQAFEFNKNVSGFAGTVSSTTGPFAPVIGAENEPVPYNATLDAIISFVNRGNGYPIFVGSVNGEGGVRVNYSASPGLKFEGEPPSVINQSVNEIYIPLTASNGDVNVTEYWLNVTLNYFYLQTGQFTISLPHVYTT